MIRLSHAIRPWALMLLALAAATALRGMLDPLLGERAPFVTYYPLTVLVALFAGAWPAAASVALSVILSGLLFGAATPVVADAVALAVYVPVNAAMIVLIERARRAGDAARASESAATAECGLLQAALQSVEAGVHSFSLETGKAEWDDRLRTLLGLGPGEPATFETLLAHVYPADRARVERAVADAISRDGPGRFSVEFRIARGDADVRWISCTGLAVFEGDRLVRVVGTGRDVTERRRVEAALRESEQRFATLADGSPALLWVSGSEGNEFVNRAYREFVGVDSDDELSGPEWGRFVHPDDRDEYANAYRAALATQGRFTTEFRLRRRDGEYRWMRSDAMPRFGDDGELVGYVGATVNVTERRVERKTQPLEIGAVVGQAVETVGPLAHAKSQALRLERDDTPLYVSGDRARLVQTVADALQDSVKHTQPGGEIVVSVRGAGPDIEVAVHDNGARIPTQLVPDRSTVALRLPRIEAPVALPDQRFGVIAARRVLVVDDSADAADSLAMLLELDGHEVATAYSAAAALETAERLQPEIAFIEIGLPQMDGYEVARRLRASDRCRAIRLVALTGRGEPGERDEARRAGFDHQLVKPADWQSVGAILAESAA